MLNVQLINRSTTQLFAMTCTDHQEVDVPTSRLTCCWGLPNWDLTRGTRHTLEP